jgi:RNA polymerase sigma-B factor
MASQIASCVSRDQVGLIEDHLALVHALARRYASDRESREELVQAGSLGLVAAASRFDPARGVPFGAYAVPTVEGEIRRHLRDRSATVRVPRREQQTARALRRAAGVASARLGREASLAEAAETAGVPLREAERVLGTAVTPVPLSAAEGSASRDAEDQLAACERRALLRPFLVALDPRERQAVALRFAGDLSQGEIARRMRISQSQASRLLAGALEKLRRELAEDGRAA